MPIPFVGAAVWYFANNQQADPHEARVIKVYHALAENGEVEPATETSPVNLLVTDPDRGTQSMVSYCPAGTAATPYSHYRWPAAAAAALEVTATVAPVVAPVLTPL